MYHQDTVAGLRRGPERLRDATLFAPLLGELAIIGCRMDTDLCTAICDSDYFGVTVADSAIRCSESSANVPRCAAVRWFSTAA